MLLVLLPLASLLPSSLASSADGFDYFVLALQWPGTVCRRSTASGPCCSSNACCRSDPIGWFTIHGLWPSYAQGNGPTCCSNPDFDMAKISNLTTELDKYWPSLYCSSPPLCSGGHGSLWAHEAFSYAHGLTRFHSATHVMGAALSAASRQWEKHGTCSYPIIQDEYSYFSAALHLYSTYNVTAMLASKISMGAADDGGGKYPVTDVVAAINKSSFGASPLLLCDEESLQELRLCFDKDLKPLDCKYGGSGTENGEVEYRRSCPRYISLPAYKPHGGGGTSGAARRTVASNMLAFFVAF